jgi:pyruvate,water dikinase
MIFYGLLRRLCTAWCGDDAGALQNDLLTGEGGMVSAEPAERVRELARMATVNQEAHPDFVNLLRTGELRAIERAMAEIPVFAQRYQAYLEKFGDRCMNELKLESRTLWDDPLPLLRSIGQLAYHLPIAAANAKSKSDLRLQAEMRVIRALDGKPWRDRIFNWVLKHARNRVRDRENLRFERTRVFGRARQIFRELGRRLYAADLLDDPDDIFCLEVEEILGFAEGTATCTNLRGLAAVRKAEFVRFAQMAPPTERFATYGMVHQGNEFQSLKQAAMGGAGAGALAPSGQDGQCLQGTGCCPGVVRGRARVVTNPLEASLEPGDIVVAEHTDPSWILILPLAAGLLVERGSLLSHAAIVARELGIPAIVALAGVTRWLRDGDWVEFDGSTGVVHKLEE